MIQLTTFISASALAVGLAFLNNHFWKKIGFWFHTLQWIGIVVVAYTVVTLTNEYYAALLVWSALHWIVFELALYLIRKLPIMYVGETAITDRFIQWIGRITWRESNGGSPYALAKNWKVALKVWYLIAALALYSLECEC